jgi:hypothetical protein
VIERPSQFQQFFKTIVDLFHSDDTSALPARFITLFSVEGQETDPTRSL